jgi:hypothetical protein
MQVPSEVIRRNIMGHRDGIFAVVALALSSLALAGMVNTDAYTRAAQAEASGYDALVSRVSNASALLCLNDAALPSVLSADAGKAVAQ